MCPERPSDPKLPSTNLNDIFRRLRDLERIRLRLPEGTDALQTFENMQPLGDTRFLDFGSGIQATLIGDDFVQVSADEGVLQFDAVVDINFTATNESRREFLGIGEALTYLWVTLALTHANVLVRPGNYTETADWQAPSQVVLYGSSGINGTLNTQWITNGFSLVTHGQNIRFMHMTVQADVGADPDLFGTNISAYDTYFALNNIPATATLCSGRISLVDCYMQGFCKLAGTEVNINGLQHVSPGAAVTLPTFFLARKVYSTGGLGTLTVPSGGTCDAEFEWPSGNTSFVMADSLAGRQLRVRGAQNCTATISGTDIGAYDLADMGNVTVSGPARKGYIGGGVSALDVTGPCTLDVAQIRSQTGPITFRGKTVKGSISSRPAGASGTFLDFVAATDCEINVAADGALASGTKKAYAFDAASLRNTVLWGIGSRGTFPVAGTDAGTGNRVLPEGAIPFVTNGHVIEDEAVVLTQRANLNFTGPLVVAADSGGKTVVSIGTGFTPGSVIFAGATGDLGEDNTNFFFDAAALSLRVASLKMGYLGTAGFYGIAHTNNFGNITDFALIQAAGGATTINAKSGQNLNFAIAGGPQMVLTANLLTFGDSRNIAFNTANGTKIGTGATQKLSFWNATPVVQPTNLVGIDVLLATVGLRAGGGTSSPFASKIYPPTDAAALQTAAGLYAGTGAPNNANGANGDFYFRSDGGALTTIYQRRAGAWVGVI